MIRLPGKELTILDKVALDFVSRISCDYVIVSGYVAILLGRSRSTEDIDLFIPKADYGTFSNFYDAIVGSGKYYCINAESSREAYEILNEKSSVRFAQNGTVDPNFEVKFPYNELSVYSLRNSIAIEFDDGRRINVGPLELQLAYKLYLGSEKDYLDAAHLYMTFKKDVDAVVLRKFIERLHIKESIAKQILKGYA